MPYDFHASTPTRYPHADSLYPSDAETLTWRPAQHLVHSSSSDKPAHGLACRTVADCVVDHVAEARLTVVLLEVRDDAGAHLDGALHCAVVVRVLGGTD